MEFLEHEVEKLTRFNRDTQEELVLVPLRSSATDSQAKLQPGDRCYFPSQTNIRDRRVTGVEILFFPETTPVPSLTITPGQAAMFVVSFLSPNGEFIFENCPVKTFYIRTAVGKIRRTDFFCDLSKSFVTLLDPAGAATFDASMNIAFLFHYRKD